MRKLTERKEWARNGLAKVGVKGVWRTRWTLLELMLRERTVRLPDGLFVKQIDGSPKQVVLN